MREVDFSEVKRLDIPRQNRFLGIGRPAGEYLDRDKTLDGHITATGYSRHKWPKAFSQ